jgi:hypothetical protein
MAVLCVLCDFLHDTLNKSMNFNCISRSDIRNSFSRLRGLYFVYIPYIWFDTWVPIWIESYQQFVWKFVYKIILFISVHHCSVEYQNAFSIISNTSFLRLFSFNFSFSNYSKFSLNDSTYYFLAVNSFYFSFTAHSRFTISFWSRSLSTFNCCEFLRISSMLLLMLLIRLSANSIYCFSYAICDNVFFSSHTFSLWLLWSSYMTPMKTSFLSMFFFRYSSILIW